MEHSPLTKAIKAEVFRTYINSESHITTCDCSFISLFKGYIKELILQLNITVARA